MGDIFCALKISTWDSVSLHQSFRKCTTPQTHHQLSQNWGGSGTSQDCKINEQPSESPQNCCALNINLPSYCKLLSRPGNCAVGCVVLKHKTVTYCINRVLTPVKYWDITAPHCSYTDLLLGLDLRHIVHTLICCWV